MDYSPDINVITLIGITLAKIDKSDEEIRFATVDGREFRMYHDQNCCESVRVEDVTGNLDDLVGSPITKAEEKINREVEDCSDSCTETTFTFATVKGEVVIQWMGSSNGYYSESVSFMEVK